MNYNSVKNENNCKTNHFTHFKFCTFTFPPTSPTNAGLNIAPEMLANAPLFFPNVCWEKNVSNGTERVRVLMLRPVHTARAFQLCVRLSDSTLKPERTAC